ncbi:MAG: hypothetical protein OEV64_05960 [Desulfobulbaceae bacterium]|nr:hypothetical protein [Desulfobulbaceae bacterium]
MKLRCPSCGATASADAYNNDAQARELLALAVTFPQPVAKVLLNYLALFRPEKTALSWSRALTIALELHALVSAGTIQVDKKVARPCNPHQWAAGIEEMLARRDGGLRLPMPNHNYLKKIVYEAADQADAKNEAAYHQAAQSGNLRSYQPKGPEPLGDDGLLPIEREMKKRDMQLPQLKKVE